MTEVGAVVIGRNEGERLARSLASLRALNVSIVYVDSGSTDGSVVAAHGVQIEVIELDRGRPFTAARARNEGFGRLRELHPDLSYVQFVDGDCELFAGWIDTATEFLKGHGEIAVVAGRLVERDRNASIYNTLCALEWERPTGEISACGGIFLARVKAFADVGGFNPDVPAAEDDELCLRLRASGWKVWSLDAEMARHDAAMTRFSQWWRRAKRAGYAYAQGAAMHGQTADRHFVRDVRRIWFWGMIVPLIALLPAWWTRGWSLLVLLGYPLLAVRIFASGRRHGWSAGDAWLYAIFTVLGKWPGLLGVLEFLRHRRGDKPKRPIEYNGETKPA
ncbi:MAG: glycosyl transferase family 2 [Phycisphaerales bacterium]|nr:glycosyl transferase family 2 [Phycisphaerales bacterium]